MTDKTKLEIIILHESVWDSIKTDIFTFGCLIASIYVGVLLQSSALQWIAGLMLMLSIITRGIHKMERHMTIPQARIRLDELEKELSK